MKLDDYSSLCGFLNAFTISNIAQPNPPTAKAMAAIRIKVEEFPEYVLWNAQKIRVTMAATSNT